MSKITAVLDRKMPPHTCTTDTERMLASNPEVADFLPEINERTTEYLLAPARNLFLNAGGTIEEWNAGMGERVRTEILFEVAMVGARRAITAIEPERRSAREVLHEAGISTQ